MAIRQKGKLIKKVLILGAILLAIQVVIIMYNRSAPPRSFEEALNEQIDKKGLSPDRKVMVKVQLALTDFMANNRGNPPRELKELVPKYFNTLPNDPTTGKPFEYKVDGRKYFLGALTTSEGGSAEKGSKESAASPEGMSKEEQKALLAMLDREDLRERSAYDPSGKRDPFRPFDVSPDLDTDNEKTPLERYDASQWFLTAVIDSNDGPVAMLQNPSGQAYSVKKGGKIGLRGGEVVEITSDHVSVLEEEVDFTGEKQTKTIEIRRKGSEESKPVLR